MGNVAAEKTIEEFDGNAEKISEYLSQNISLVNDINNEMGNGSQITGIESILPIAVIDCDKEYTAFLSDFNNDEGYYLLADDYNLLDWQINAESPFETVKETENISNYFYCPATGYFYEENGEMLSVNSENNCDEAFSAGQHYNGQENEQTGCGKIINPTDYVKDKYGSSYVFCRGKIFELYYFQ